MLCLTRRIGEGITLVLPDGREVYVGIRHRSKEIVQLTIEAPPDVKIWRDELLAAVTKGLPRTL